MTLKELFSDPSKWTRNSYCRDAEGNGLGLSSVDSPDAVCWCLIGGIHKVYHIYCDYAGYTMANNRIEQYLKEHYRTTDIVNANDNLMDFQSLRKMLEELDI